MPVARKRGRPAQMRLRSAPAFRSRGLAITTTVVGLRRVLDIAGEVDVATAPSLTAALQTAVASCEREIWVDLTGVTFVDLRALHALLAVRDRLERDGRRLALIAPSGPVRRFLED